MVKFNSLGSWFRRQSVGRKLTTTALFTSGVTLLAACTVFAIYDYVNDVAEVVDKLPAEPHDVRMTHALTPQRGLVTLG